jgi:hypothetical protein
MKVKIKATIEYEQVTELSELLCEGAINNFLDQLRSYGTAELTNVEMVPLEANKKNTRKAKAVRNPRRRVPGQSG